MPVVETPTKALYSRRRRAEPLLWLSAAAVVVAVGLLVLLLGLLVSRGLSEFWPQPLLMLEKEGAGTQLGRLVKRQRSAFSEVPPTRATKQPDDLLLYRGGSDVFQPSLLWLRENASGQQSWPDAALVVERQSAPPVFAFLHSVQRKDKSVAMAGAGVGDQLKILKQENFSSASFRLASGEKIDLPLSQLRRVHAPNRMSLDEKLGFFFTELYAFLSESPRQVNAEGGVFPAIVGTVVLVLLMSVLVTPLGILAAIYLQEYAHRGLFTRLVRISVNNLAGVPSIVYGVFGLGFFVYGVGGSLDSMFFSETLPAPTLGTPGLLWASLTMALLTLPVVIVATEEGLARVPQSLREGSLALGATRAETLWRVVLPAASPALLTGLILAVARATGEVAPLILVGVAKYAPVLPVSGEFPFLHLDRQFMHLGFHIYDLGFQSPQLELATGRVFSTALLLVLIVMLLNVGAVILRGRLREAFKAQDLL